MRVLLALLALVGLLLAPVAASAATLACMHQDGVVGMMADVAMTTHADANAKADACCDHGAGKPAKPGSRACAQACATVCGGGIALVESISVQPLTVTHARFAPAAPAPLHAHAPPGLRRPPRHQA